MFKLRGAKKKISVIINAHCNAYLFEIVNKLHKSGRAHALVVALVRIFSRFCLIVLDCWTNMFRKLTSRDRSSVFAIARHGHLTVGLRR